MWVSVRGKNDIAVLDGTTYHEKTRNTVPNGPGMTIFSPDGKLGDVCPSFTPETVVISTTDHTIVGHGKQESPFCPDIAATPDGKQGLRRAAINCSLLVICFGCQGRDAPIMTERQRRGIKLMIA